MQNGLHDEPGVWEDFGEPWQIERVGRRALALAVAAHGDECRFRLVRRRVEDTVIEGPTE